MKMKGERNYLLLSIYYDFSPFIPHIYKVGFIILMLQWEAGSARLNNVLNVCQLERTKLDLSDCKYVHFHNFQISEN